MAFMACNPLRLFQAREVADQTAIALPTVSKLLKKLAKHKLLVSHRGTHGGYLLAQSPENITVADLVQALEGPIAITECSLGHDHCPTETLCSTRIPWLQINQVITAALQSIKLANFVGVPPSHQTDWLSKTTTTATPSTYPLRWLEGQHGHH